MGWEKRGNKTYYYKKERKGGSVVSRYDGRGDLAQVFAHSDLLCWYIKKLKRDEDKAKKEAYEAIDLLIDETLESVYKLIKAVFLSTGHYQHKGQWRKRGNVLPEKEVYQVFETTVEKNEGVELRLDLLLNTIDSSKPSPRAVAELKDFLIKHRQIWKNISRLLGLTFKTFLDREVPEAAKRGIIKRSKKQLKKDLGWEESPTLTRIIIDGVALAYFSLCIAQQEYSEFMATPEAEHSVLALYWEKRLTNAHQQYLRACESLVRVGKMSQACPELRMDFSKRKVIEDGKLSQKA